MTAKSVFRTPAGEMVVDSGRKSPDMWSLPWTLMQVTGSISFMEKFWMQKEISTIANYRSAKSGDNYILQ